MAKNIVGLNIDGISYTNRPFGTCSTAAATGEKEVVCSGFELAQNATILVKFANKNTVLAPALNVNGTGAKPIRCDMLPTIGDNIKAGGIYEFIYDGTYWRLFSGFDTNDKVTQNPITTPVNRAQPLLMLPGTSAAGTVTNSVQYHEGLTYNPSTQTLGLGVLNCTTNDSGDNSNEIDIFANRQLPTIFRFGIPTAVENIAPSTSINLMYSGPGVAVSEARGYSLSIGPRIIDDTTTRGFLISTGMPLHIEGSSLSFGSIGSSLIPTAAYNLGSSISKWNTVYANTFKGTADSARLTPYGVCSTSSMVVAKVVEETSVPFVLETGVRISVKFTYNNSASDITLNVNRTGDKNVYFNGSKVGSGTIFANNVYEFIYDGTNYILQPGVHNTAGSGSSTSKLFLIGATSQSSSGVRTYSNSNVYTQSGSIYSNGFYDHSTATNITATTGASVYKAVVPKDYTEDIGGSNTAGSHRLSTTLTASVSVQPPSFGGLVGEYDLTVGTTKVITPTPSAANQTYSTSLAISLTTTNITPNFRFVRLLLSVPLTVSNISAYPLRFSYTVRIRLNNGSYKSIAQTFNLASNTVRTIGNLSIIYDLMRQTIIDDTANGTTSWC